MAPAPGFDEAVFRVRTSLAGRVAMRLDVPGFRPAAVLVPLLARPTGPTVLFTRRTESLAHHKGEISFPGGGRDEGESAEGAALREAQEEVGLEGEGAEILGTLDDVPSIAGYVVTPVVAAVRKPPASFRPSALEVSEPFEIPLSALLDPAIRRSQPWSPDRLPPQAREALLRARIPFERVDPEGRWLTWSFHADPDRVVWGLTARVLADLLDRAFRG